MRPPILDPVHTSSANVQEIRRVNSRLTTTGLVVIRSLVTVASTAGGARAVVVRPRSTQAGASVARAVVVRSRSTQAGASVARAVTTSAGAGRAYSGASVARAIATSAGTGVAL